MIEPFEQGQIRDGVISFGVSSFGYDLRVSDEFKIFTNVNNSIIDPKNFSLNPLLILKVQYVSYLQTLLHLHTVLNISKSQETS